MTSRRAYPRHVKAAALVLTTALWWMTSASCSEPECSYEGTATVFELNINFEPNTSQETIDEVVECIEGRKLEQLPPAFVRVEIQGRDSLCDALETLDDEESVTNVVTNF